ncbi:MAG: amino acid ABC transporter permease [Chloroflexota bacterium]|jgi:general L-amino acid transport system permease protein|nr:amino acid ABC transporter permease [Chloroflexota bacterium]MQG20361.1 amino acid ABC transporter permease [SAR202 cluster bacterium]MEC7920402.1 amino acid ABC transporter permease [Chloroflexota bacterium]MEC9098760.1 amino acid ABC transporter permease [Chloroflexota bacterium]MEC9107141.1 amino acid ABC transporter permease [Chloroflexota bacterium]|tara:strand:- start:2052 stop:3206 length:1155 start_codon:yes stop_codon:yes gene_type:complete
MQLFTWIKDNLLASKLDVFLTLVGAYFIYYIFSLFFTFVFTSDWTLIEVNRKILLVGLFPEEQLWRIWSIFYVSSVLLTSTISLVYGFQIKTSAFYIIMLLIPFWIFTTVNMIFHVAILLLLSLLSYMAIYYLKKTTYKSILSKVIIGSWIIFIPFMFLILVLGGGPKVTLWGGFFVNLILAIIAILAGFPLGVIFALGRASSYKTIKLVSVIFIETFRGAPLIAWLFFAWFVLPNFLPDLFSLSDINLIIRAMIVLSLFSSAYVAEVVRGGLQSIPKGQKEAATALGLNTFKELFFITLPQAIRIVIPAIVSTFIAIFKDTSLVFILGITDLLRIGRLIPEQQQEFYGKSIEVLLIVALLFWVVSIILSQISRSIENRLNVSQ